MRIKKPWLFLTICLAATLLASTDVFAWQTHPDEVFLTLHTEHFRITYPQEWRFEAVKTAVIAEEAFAALTKRLKWTPHTPFDILLLDRTDDANGFSRIEPMQLMVLYLAPPHPEDRLDYYDDYLHMLITHEMTHAIHTDANRAIPGAIRKVFGRVKNLGHIYPFFMIEGIAVHEETALNTRGRARSPFSWMMLRMAALDDNWPTIDRISSRNTAWPSGGGAYIFGGMFHHYLAQRFGEEALADYNIKHSGQIWPYLYNHDSRLIFGYQLTDLYDAWSINLQRAFAAQKEELAKEGLSATIRLTKEGYSHSQPTWLDNHTILFAESIGTRSPQLRKIDIRQKARRSRPVVKTRGTRGYAVTAGGDIVYANNESADRWLGYNDLWRYRPGERRGKRLTRFARANEPAAIPGSEDIICVTHEGGRSRLSRYHAATGAFTHLTDFGDYDDYVNFARIAVHPSGAWLAVSVWHDDGNRDLFAFDPATKTFRRLTADHERDIDPAFDPTGRYLFFTSGRTGIYNIYALDLRTDELFRVTNVLGGAFMPAIDPSGTRLAFIGYNGGGFDLYWMPLDRALFKPVPREAIAEPGIVMGSVSRRLHEQARSIDPPTDAYSAWRTVWPHYWMPDIGFGSDETWLGATTGGADALGEHNWSAGAMYAVNKQFIHAGAAYSYSGMVPTFAVGVLHSLHNHGKIIEDEDGDSIRYYERRIGGTATMGVPLTLRSGAYAGYIGVYRSDWRDVPPGNDDISFTGYWSGLRIGWSYDDVRSYLHSIGGIEGARLGVQAIAFDPLLGSEVRQQIFTATGAQFISLPLPNHALALRASGGAGFGEVYAQRSFRIGSFQPGDLLDSGTFSDRLPLRGYSVAARGDFAAVGSLEWNFPLARINRGLWTWPLFLQTISAGPFADAGFAIDRDERLTMDDLYPSTGVDFSLDTVLSYYYSVRFNAGFGYGLRDRDETGGFRWRITLGGIF